MLSNKKIAVESLYVQIIGSIYHKWELIYVKERNILAGFQTEDDAQEAEKALRQAGFSIIQIDRIGQFPGDGNEQIMNPISGDFPSLGSLTLAGDFPSGRDASIMAAVDPDASGMADRGDDNLYRSVLLTAVVPEEQGDLAIEIIRSYGGMI
ncbi:hypothetical protein [Brevibacillus porteri]|uniref:General stress protein 17M-like domain-containing protein n=1 Tax=Brevibacillus porteri TaxID=2126350 RepID=A0ABX5FMC8_9BACL|nr:hypothetical protein [Brevibacillus porteri]MED1799953.1 hypothetical protein [Brevibacillus porteri]MED2132976.1 hypothetical protein [Brevibacillus porteri]MED2744112.1 hypothetical protein [Brevibacillus porteri]MED2816848.1 hypothetical protein [Brevibacillus porteri]MED2894423.1 hypothetical protein [Brevibacillus porteri]